MNKYNVYTVFTYENVTQVTARNEKSAVNKIKDMAETFNLNQFLTTQNKNMQ